MSQISRRAFATILPFFAWIFSLIVGCSNSCTPKIGSKKRASWKEYAIESIGRRHESKNVTFDPLLASLLVSFLFGLLKQCIMAQIMRQHRAVKREPNGSIARRLSQRLSQEFSVVHPEADDESVHSHCAAAVKAFANATDEELIRTIQEASSAPADPSESEWSAAIVRTLEETTSPIKWGSDAE